MNQNMYYMVSTNTPTAADAAILVSQLSRLHVRKFFTHARNSTLDDIVCGQNGPARERTNMQSEFVRIIRNISYVHSPSAHTHEKNIRLCLCLCIINCRIRSSTIRRTIALMCANERAVRTHARRVHYLYTVKPLEGGISPYKTSFPPQLNST